MVNGRLEIFLTGRETGESITMEIRPWETAEGLALQVKGPEPDP